MKQMDQSVFWGQLEDTARLLRAGEGFPVAQGMTERPSCPTQWGVTMGGGPLGPKGDVRRPRARPPLGLGSPAREGGRRRTRRSARGSPRRP